MSHLKPINILLYTASLAILSSMLLSFYLTFTPITILKNWSIQVDGDSHKPGEVIAVQSIYTKTKNVSGVASRYIECRNRNGSFTRYPVNQAKANRAAGNTATGVYIKIPDVVPDLPTVCHVSISIDYQIYKFRTVSQSKSSSDFKLLDPTSISPPTSQESQATANFLAQPTMTTNSAPSTPAKTSTASPTPADPPKQESQNQPQPSILERIISPLTDILGGL